jgi:hypothetical protein
VIRCLRKAVCPETAKRSSCLLNPLERRAWYGSHAIPIHLGLNKRAQFWVNGTQNGRPRHERDLDSTPGQSIGHFDADITASADYRRQRPPRYDVIPHPNRIIHHSEGEHARQIQSLYVRSYRQSACGYKHLVVFERNCVTVVLGKDGFFTDTDSLCDAVRQNPNAFEVCPVSQALPILHLAADIKGQPAEKVSDFRVSQKLL